MTRYFLKKLLGLVPLFLGITLVSFVVVHLAPGTVVDASSSFNPKMTAAAKEKLAQLYSLDKPVLVQYADWVGRLVRLDFGVSYADGQKVTRKIADAVPVTLGI